MAQLTPLTLEAVRTLARTWGLKVVANRPLSAGSVNSNFQWTTVDGTQVFARLYEEQAIDGARFEVALVRRLRELGLPVACSLAGTEHEIELALYAGKPVAAFEWVEGSVLHQRQVTPAVCRSVGAVLGKLHRATTQLGSLPSGRFKVSDLEQRLATIERLAEERGDLPAWQGVVTDLRQRLVEYVGRRCALPTGITHGDLFRDNILWAEGRTQPTIAAVIDFESASADCYVYDLMVTVHAWCFGASFDEPLIEALLRGYRSERELSVDEWDALTVEGGLAALRFAITRITDFSLRVAPGAVPARDYRRFLQRLEAIESGCLDRTVAKLRNGLTSSTEPRL